MIDNPATFNVSGTFKPMYFLTASDNKNIGFKITAQPIKLFDDNIELNISLEKHPSGNKFMIISNCNDTEVNTAAISITKTRPTLADLAGGYQTVSDAYNQAKDALLAIIPGDNKNRWERDKINEEIAKLQNYPFKGKQFQLNAATDPDGDMNTYILFKRRPVREHNVTALLGDQTYIALPYKIVFNGVELPWRDENEEFPSGNNLLEEIWATGNASGLSKFYTKGRNKEHTDSLYFPIIYMNKKKPNSNNIDARVHLDFKLMKSTSHLGIDNKNPSNNWIDAHVGSGGPMQKLKKEGVDALIYEINLVFSKSYKEENRTGSNREANNNEIKKRINTFKENVRKAFENINLHIDILKIKPEYATILQTYIAAEKNLDDYYKSKTEAYFSNKGIASPIPENEWSYPNNGKSKTFDDLKDQVTVGIGNRKNISFVKDYFTNTDYFGGEGSK